MKKIVSLVITMMVFLPCVSFGESIYDESLYYVEDSIYREFVYYAKENGTKTRIQLPQERVHNSIVYPDKEVDVHPESITYKKNDKIRKRITEEYYSENGPTEINNHSQQHTITEVFDENGNPIKSDKDTYNEYSSGQSEWSEEIVIQYTYDDGKIVNKSTDDGYKSEEYEYYYDDQGRLYKTKAHAYACDYYIDEMKFDKDGRETEYTIQFHSMEEGSDGTVEDIISNAQVQKYEYYASGLLKTVTTDRSNLNWGYTVKTVTYQYNDDRQVTSITTYHDKAIVEIESFYYNSEKQLIKHRVNNYYDDTEDITEYEYDWIGRLLYCGNSESGDYNKGDYYKYNENGLLEEIDSKYGDDTRNRIKTFEYDDALCLISMKETYEALNYYSEEDRAYNYDDSGRLISAVTSEQIDISNGLVKRTNEQKVSYEYDTLNIEFIDPGNAVVEKYTIDDAASGQSKVFRFKVKNTNASVAAIIREDGSYEVLKAEATNDPDIHTFTVNEVTDNMTIAVVPRGDLNLDGKIAVNDVTMAKAASLSKLDLAPEAKLAADMNGDGVIRPNEVAMLRAAALKKAKLSW